MIPSAKLLSLVLACNVTEVGEIHGNTLGFSIDNADVGRINIYELEHLVKEWATNTYGYYIVSMGIIHCHVYLTADISDANKKVVSWDFAADCKNEYESVFAAAHWIITTR